MRFKAIVSALQTLALLLGGVACGKPSNGPEASRGSDMPKGITFPVQDPTEMKMQALLRGTLTQHGRCLYVSVEEPNRNVLPIWPYGFSYEHEGEGVRVIDPEGKVVAEVGSAVSMGGGMFGESDSPLPADLRTRVESCDGPFWIVGDIEKLH
jgi:hypothetical protein